MKRNLLLLIVMVGVVVLLSGFTWAQDPGVNDTLYVQVCSGDQDFIGTPGVTMNKVRVLITVTNDVPNPATDSIAAFTIPLHWTSSNPAAYCSVSSYWNTNAFFGPSADRSIFRHLLDEATGDTILVNRMMWMAWQFMGWEWDTRIIDTSDPNFWMALIATGASDRRWWEGSQTLLATMTFSIYDSTTIHIDTTFWPPSTRLAFTKSNGQSHIPVLRIDEIQIARAGGPRPPTAFIDGITPNPAEPGENVAFVGHGADTDGSVVAYNWRSSIDGQLSTDSSFGTSALSVGNHTIYFKVQDNEGNWSEEAYQNLIINRPPVSFIDSISPNPATDEETVVFGGHGTDVDGFTMAYHWRSDIDGQLSTDSSFGKSGLSAGTHTIYFKVRDDLGAWSQEVSQTLVITCQERLDISWAYPQELTWMGRPYSIWLTAEKHCLPESEFLYGLQAPEWLTSVNNASTSASHFGNDYFWTAVSDSLDVGIPMFYQFEASNSWDWVPPPSTASYLLSVGLKLIPGLGIIWELFGRYASTAKLLKTGVDYARAFSDLEETCEAFRETYRINPCAVIQYEGLGDSYQGIPDTVICCVPPLKVTFLQISLFWQQQAILVGIASPAAGIYAPFFKTLQALMTTLSYSSYSLAYDPDANYAELVSPEFVYPPELDSIQDPEALQRIREAFRGDAYRRALESAYSKYQGAMVDGNTEWAATQLSAVRLYSRLTAECLRPLPDFISAHILEPTQGQVDSMRNSFATNGLPDITQSILAGFGFSQGEIDELGAAFATIPDEYYYATDLIPDLLSEVINSLDSLSEYFHEIPGEALLADMATDPCTLSEEMPSGVLSCYLEFLGVSDLNGYQITSALLNGSIVPVYISSAPDDYDSDGIPDLLVEFDAATVILALEGGEQLLSVAGEVLLPAGDSVPYHASATATVPVLLGPEVYLVAADYEGRSNYVLRVDGTFSNQQYMGQVPQPYYSYGNGIGDFDNDGDFDYLIGTGYYTDYAHHIYLYEKLADGNAFATPVSVDTWTEGGYPMDMAVADYNNDGNMDFVLTHYASPNCELYLGNGDLTFTRSVLQSTAPTYSIGADAADFDNDGNVDFVVSHYSNSNPDPGEDVASDTTGHNPYYVYINLGNGDGTFTTGDFLASSNSWGVTAGDFDNDGNADIVTDGYWSTADFYFYGGNGDGTFQSGVVAAGLTKPANVPSPVDNFDFNHDGNMDIVIGYLDNVRYYAGNGDGTFTYVTEIAGGTGYERYCLSAPPVEVIEPGSPIADADPNVQDISVGGTASFDGSNSYDTDGGTIVSYEWDFRDGNTGTGVTASHTYAAEKIYRVRLTVTDNDGKRGSDYVTVTVLGDPPVADADGPYSGRTKSPLTFDGSGSSDDFGIVNYEWNFGDGETGTGIMPTHTYGNIGTYTVTLTVYDAVNQSNTCTTTATIESFEDYFVYSQLNTGCSGSYGVDGYVGADGVDRIIFYSGGTAYIYTVAIPEGSDPNMHPNNPEATGPVAPRTFTLEKTFPLGVWPGHECEFFVDAEQNVVYLGASVGIRKYIWDESIDNYVYESTVAPAAPGEEGYGTQTLAYDPESDTWYAGSIAWNYDPGNTLRDMWKYDGSQGNSGNWALAFQYTTPEGIDPMTHHDGMEYINGYLWLADYVGDYIKQYTTDGMLVAVFWHEPLQHELEGMGYGAGALKHFWCGSHGSLITEFGGGRLQIAVEGIPDQCIYVGETFETFDLDDYVMGQPPFNWTWTGNVDLTVSVDSENVVTVGYPDGWWGSETITFTVTDSIGRSASDEATFKVCPVPVVLDIPDQNWPFPPFDLDDYLDPNCGVDPGDVTWTASGMVYFVVEIDSVTHMATVTNPTGSNESETITFTATASACCPGKPTARDSDEAIFNMLGAICGYVVGEGGVPQFDPVGDAHITHGSPDVNAGSHSFVTLRNDYGAGGSDWWAFDVLIKFDISSIAPGTNISSATLNLYYYEWFDNDPAGHDLELYRITGDWSEDNVTWNNQPTFCSTPTDITPVPNNPGVWVEWDVTDDVQDFVNGQEPNHGWHLKDGTYWGQYDIPYMHFRSKEYGSYVPFLQIITDPVPNVTVKVIDSDNNQVGDPIITGSDGAFYFDSLLVGTYSVMIVTPLGYSVSPGETQPGIEVTGYPCTEVYFVLTPTITSNDCRTIGYWKHQFDVYLSGRGHAQEDSSDLEDYLDLVHLHFDVLGVYIDLESFDFEDAKDVLTVSGGQLMEDRAKQQLFGLLLNFASGKISNETVISEDDRVAAEAVTYVALLINNGDPANDELAKTICDLINNGQMVEAGVIPESPIRYRDAEHAGTPIEFALHQNYPNPFNPECQIGYILPTDCQVTLSIYNILGQKVRVLVDEYQNAGHKSVKWNGKDDQGQEVTSGVYFYRLQAGDFTEAKKMLLLK